jgi:cytosine/adenosine deaminase-related metal-dependent hydrolase
MILIRAGWLLPITSAPIRDGCVAVESGRVVWLGRFGAPDAPEVPTARVHALGSGVLLPGLVNAHTHLELSHLAGRLAPTGDGFCGWAEAVVASRGRFGSDEIGAACDAAISGLEACGTVAVGDVSNTLGHLDRLSRSSLSAVVFLELLAWDPDAAMATLQWGERLLQERRGAERPGLRLRLAAHAPHSVSPELLCQLSARGGPAAIHLAESPEEAQFIASGTGGWPAFLAARGLGQVRFAPAGKSPTRYCEGLGVLHPRLVAAHGVQLDAADRRLLAERGVHVVLCPRSNRALGVGQADVPALEAAGVKLALGSDSLASAPSLDVLEDAVLLRRQFPELATRSILRMATLGGAMALGFAELGAVEPGRRAALAYAPADAFFDDPEAFLLSGAARLRNVAIDAAPDGDVSPARAGVSNA